MQTKGSKMRVEKVNLKGFRNFKNATINFAEHTLVIGANDIGKSNLLYAIRILLDHNLSDSTIEPIESDFYVSPDGKQDDKLSILIKLTDIKEDAVISRFKGYISDNGTSYLMYVAYKDDLSYEIFIGHREDALEKIENRYSYLKNIHLRYIQSTRDLFGFIRSEKRNLLSIAKKERTEEAIKEDFRRENSIQTNLSTLNKEINELTYVSNATSAINEELSKLSFRNSEYAVQLEAGTINLSTYIDQLSLNATDHERTVGLGGDGRNNQILMALWKAKSEYEFDFDSEAIIYCIEEPEAHLHPHQQRKFAKYLVENLKGQVIVTSHSPQIVEHFEPDKIIRLYKKDGYTLAASNGCSKIIEEAWDDLGYRMSIIPAETFFADAVFLVEGPSEVLFYNALAKAQKIDFDFLNISIIHVYGVSFSVYTKILKAMHIPYVLRTDNDVSKVPNVKIPSWRLAGLNRGRDLAGMSPLSNLSQVITPDEVCKSYSEIIRELQESGIYISHADLEHDIAEIIPEALCHFFNCATIAEAILFLQGAKAIRMRDFILRNKEILASENFLESDLFAPLQFLSNTLSMKREK